jgi:adenylate cyclase
VRNILVAHALPPITMKGINREIIPYAVEGMLDASGRMMEVFSEHMTGLDLYFDPTVIDDDASPRVRAILEQALASLARSKPPRD